MQSYHIQI